MPCSKPIRKIACVSFFLFTLCLTGCGKDPANQQKETKSDTGKITTQTLAATSGNADVEGIYLANSFQEQMVWYHVTPDGKGGWEIAESWDNSSAELRTSKDLFLVGERTQPSGAANQPSQLEILPLRRSPNNPRCLDELSRAEKGAETITPVSDWPQDFSSFEKRTVELPAAVVQFTDNRALAFLLDANPKDDLEPAIAQRLFATAQAMVADHTDEPHYRFFLLRALKLGKKWPELRAELESQKALYEGNRSLTHAYRMAQVWLASAETGNPGTKLVGEILTKDFAGQIAAIPEIQKLEQFRPVGFHGTGIGNSSFLNIQVLAKTMRVAVVLKLLAGDQHTALEVAAGSYALGQGMSQGSDTVIGCLIGTAVRAISAGSLQMLTLNVGENAEEVDAIRQKLEPLNTREVSYASRSFFYYEPVGPYLDAMEQIKDSSIHTTDQESSNRHTVANAQFQLARMGAAMRRVQLGNGGALPNNLDPLKPLFPNGLPGDPFTSSSLQLRPADDGMVCYSVGPDKVDGQAMVQYDVTNGSMSSGDIFMRVPRQREFPFPSKGVKASSRAEFLQQMPNGLPPDPFADTRNRQLTITETAPVFVYSFGPDCDERARSYVVGQTGVQGTAVMEPNMFSVDTQAPNVAYDPTNGTRSKGDIFLTISPSVK